MAKSISFSKDGERVREEEYVIENVTIATVDDD